MSFTTVQRFGGTYRLVLDATLKQHIHAVVTTCCACGAPSAAGSTASGATLPVPRPTILTATAWKDAQLQKLLPHLVWQEKTKGQEAYLLWTRHAGRPRTFLVLPCGGSEQWQALMVPGIAAPSSLYKNTLLYGTLAPVASGAWKYFVSDVVQMSGSWDVPLRSFRSRMGLQQHLQRLMYVDIVSATPEKPAAPFTIGEPKVRALAGNATQMDRLLDSTIQGADHACSGMVLVHDRAQFRVGPAGGDAAWLWTWEPSNERTVRLHARQLDDRVLLYAASGNRNDPLSLVADQPLVATLGSVRLVTGSAAPDADDPAPLQTYEDACEAAPMDTTDGDDTRATVSRLHQETLELYWDATESLWRLCRLCRDAVPSPVARVKEVQQALHPDQCLGLDDLLPAPAPAPAPDDMAITA
jgi:hypothetical protein